ncbi:unnamed protein product, partial [Ectocarpus sp. 4 AP-2014]
LGERRRATFIAGFRRTTSDDVFSLEPESVDPRWTLNPTIFSSSRARSRTAIAAGTSLPPVDRNFSQDSLSSSSPRFFASIRPLRWWSPKSASAPSKILIPPSGGFDHISLLVSYRIPLCPRLMDWIPRV